MDGPAITIRRATADDCDALLDCLRAAFEPYRAHYTAGGYADTTLTRDTLAARLTSMVVLVACADAEPVAGTIAGAATAPGEGHIRGVAVRPAWHGSPVAGRLLASIERELAARGCTHVTLDTTAPLARASRFYEKHGYRRSGKETDFYGMPLYEFVKTLSAVHPDNASSG